MKEPDKKKEISRGGRRKGLRSHKRRGRKGRNNGEGKVQGQKYINQNIKGSHWLNDKDKEKKIKGGHRSQ